MILGKKLSLRDLIELCRVLRHSLLAGLTLREVFDQQAKKGRLAVRPVAERISLDLRRGEDLESALERERAAFPPLFLSLAVVGQQSGKLPEVFGELEQYYDMQLKLRRLFLGQIAWPVIQFFGAVFVIAALLWILGLLPTGPTGKPTDPLGLGLIGARGAGIFLFTVFCFLGGLLAAYLFVTRGLKHGATFDRICLNIPVLGPCFRALALSRFCLALRVTTETGMPIHRAAALAMAATGNSAYRTGEPKVRASLKEGTELTQAFSDPILFPQDFRHILGVAEESGRLHDVLAQQTEHYQDESRRRLLILTHVAAWGVWLLVAGLIIFAIIRIFMTSYLGPINDLSNF